MCERERERVHAKKWMSSPTRVPSRASGMMTDTSTHTAMQSFFLRDDPFNIAAWGVVGVVWHRKWVWFDIPVLVLVGPVSLWHEPHPRGPLQQGSISCTHTHTIQPAK